MQYLSKILLIIAIPIFLLAAAAKGYYGPAPEEVQFNLPSGKTWAYNASDQNGVYDRHYSLQGETGLREDIFISFYPYDNLPDNARTPEAFANENINLDKAGCGEKNIKVLTTETKENSIYVETQTLDCPAAPKEARSGFSIIKVFSGKNGLHEILYRSTGQMEKHMQEFVQNVQLGNLVSDKPVRLPAESATIRPGD